MKKLLWVLVIIIMSTGITYAQELLGKTKTQVKIIVSKRIAPRNFSEAVGTTPILGYDKWWYSSKVDPSYFCYFDNKGICFLECVMTKDLSFLKLAIEYYKTQSNYNIYGNDNPEIAKTHQFIEEKISIEITTTKNRLGNIFHLWIFKSKHKQEILDFFEKYYK